MKTLTNNYDLWWKYLFSCYLNIIILVLLGYAALINLKVMLPIVRYHAHADHASMLMAIN